MPGFHGPDPRLVAVAEQYARDNGITLHRQSHYVAVDDERASRIAEAYADMPHAPNDPRVKAAYKALIAQTTDQYRALEKAGYKFWFIDLSQPSNEEYAASPWNAMRDVRENQVMGVLPSPAKPRRMQPHPQGPPMTDEEQAAFQSMTLVQRAVWLEQEIQTAKTDAEMLAGMSCGTPRLRALERAGVLSSIQSKMLQL